MGRHSSSEQGHFYRSFFGWAGLWAMVAIATGVAVWFLVAAIGGPETTKPVVAGGEEKAQERDAPEPTVRGARVANVEETPEPVVTETEAPEPHEPDNAGKLVTEGITIQVLNGTLDDGAAQVMADKLSRLGYSIVAVEESRRLYNDTTVFWSTAESREAATLLAERFGWSAEPKPGNLSDSVSFHVVVGADEAR